MALLTETWKVELNEALEVTLEGWRNELNEMREVEMPETVRGFEVEAWSVELPET